MYPAVSVFRHDVAVDRNVISIEQVACRRRDSDDHRDVVLEPLGAACDLDDAEATQGMDKAGRVNE